MAVISAPLGSAATRSRSMWRDLDWSLLLLIALLSVWSIATIASATRGRDETFSPRPAFPGALAPSNASTSSASQGSSGAARAAESGRSGISDVAKQSLWVVAGLALMLGLALKDYQFWMHLQGWLYGLNLILLAGLLALPDGIAPEINGAKSWIRLGPLALQPSEGCKFVIIVSLAAFLCRRQEKIRELPTVLSSLLFLAPPLALILKQPDFGTSLAILAIWFGMMFFGGARLRHLGIIALIGAISFGAMWKTGRLKPHQKARLAVFLNNNPSTRVDKAAGYQIKQSQIAIGGGQLSGQGYGQGMQNRAGYVPENSTDFIFTVVAEELGFIGAASLLALYMLLLMRTSAVAMGTDNYFGTLIAGGFTALLAFHTVVNLGMTMRVMPITGVPLPFFSYGGSSYLAFSLCAGLLQSIALRQKKTGSL
jgi:rod shape determining protein RodA